MQGIATNARAIAGLECYAVLPDAINPLPTFAPTLVDEVDYHLTMRVASVAQFSITAMLYIPRADSESDRMALFPYIVPTGASSILAALEADKTLGGAAKDLVVDKAINLNRLTEVAGNKYLTATFPMRVIA